MTDPDISTPAMRFPAGGRLLLRRQARWIWMPAIIILTAVVLGTIALNLGQQFGVVVVVCGFVVALTAMFGWAGIATYRSTRGELHAMARGEYLSRWTYPEALWQALDNQWRSGEPAGEICLSRNAIYLGSPARHFLFLDWNTRRSHLSAVEYRAGDPNVLHLEIFVPSSGRIPSQRIPLFILVPPEKQEEVMEAIRALESSDAVREKGGSYVDLLILIAFALTLGYVLLSKLGVLPR